MNQFKNVLKLLRKREQFSQTELAEQLGVSKKTISMYEAGNREPDFKTLYQISEIFDVDMNYLFGHSLDTENVYTEYYPKVFGENLNKSMKQNEKTAEEVIHELNLNPSAFSAWCNGNRLPDASRVELLARYFRITPQDLLEEKESKDSYTDTNTISTLGIKITERRNALHISQIELGNRLGIKGGYCRNALHALETGTVEYITRRKLSALAKALLTSETYLLGEISEDFLPNNSLSTEENELLKCFRKLNNENKDTIKKYMELISEEQENADI